MVAKMGVAAPALTPRRYGLLSVANIVTETDPHWLNGVKFQPDACGGGGGSFADPCPTPEARTKELNGGMITLGGDPFAAYGGWSCSPVGLDQAEMQRRAEANLLATEESTVESVFWTGTTSNDQEVHPHLAEDTASTTEDFDWPAATVLSGSVVTPAAGLALLEDALAECYPGQGVVHMAPSVATLLGTDHLFRQGGNLETLLGTRAAVGSGYVAAGSVGPTGAPSAGAAWVYATSAVTIRRGGIVTVGDFASSVDRVANTVTRIVERTYVVTLDCPCLLAVQVDISP